MTDVLVVGRVRVHRESISAALDKADSLSVVGEAETLGEALPQLSGRERPAVVLLDCPQLGDLVVAAPLVTELDAKLVAVGVPEDEGVAWIEAGASGFVPPDGSLEDVVVALERVAADELVVPPRVAAHLARRVRHLAAYRRDSSSEEALTLRESEILDLLAKGLSNKQIGQRLFIQEQTVKNHVHNVLAKLGVNRRAEAAALWRSRHRPGAKPFVAMSSAFSSGGELAAVTSAGSMPSGSNFLIGYDPVGREVARFDLNAMIESLGAS